MNLKYSSTFEARMELPSFKVSCRFCQILSTLQHNLAAASCLSSDTKPILLFLLSSLPSFSCLLSLNWMDAARFITVFFVSFLLFFPLTLLPSPSTAGGGELLVTSTVPWALIGSQPSWRLEHVQQINHALAGRAGGWVGLVSYTFPGRGGREGSGTCILFSSPLLMWAFRLCTVQWIMSRLLYLLF